MTQEKLELEVESTKPHKSWRVFKNVVIVSVAFTLHFTGYNGTVNIQSSINATSGLGTASLAAVYAGLILSNLFLPVAVIKWLGTKWTICFSCLTYIPYMIGQLYPRFQILIPAGFVVGLGAGPLWCAQGTYLALAAESHSNFVNVAAKDLLVRFLGLFYMIFPTNQIWGNLVSSLVLSSGNNTAAVTNINETMIPILCGANFLPDADADIVLPPQPVGKIQMIVGIYLTCITAAILLVAFGLDAMNRNTSNSKESEARQSPFALLAVTIKHCAQPTQLLLIIINMFIGLHQAFFGADFTASFISCAVGTGSVGFVLMTYGISDAVGCFITGYLVKVFGRLPLMICALLLHGGILVTLLVWKPHAGDVYLMYIFAGLWGLCDSVWTVQISAYYGILFTGKEEAAFSSFRLWESLGYIIAFVMSPLVRTRYKIYLLIGMMTTGTVGYLIVEYQQYRLKNKVEVLEKKEEAPMMKAES